MLWKCSPKSLREIRPLSIKLRILNNNQIRSVYFCQLRKMKIKIFCFFLTIVTGLQIPKQKLSLETMHTNFK